MSTKVSYVFTENDTEPPLRAALKDANDNPYDLTNHDVYFVMSTLGFDNKVHAACSIESAVNGIVVYSWLPADVDTPGEYIASFEATDKTSGKQRTFPSDDYIYITIRKSLSP